MPRSAKKVSRRPLAGILATGIVPSAQELVDTAKAPSRGRVYSVVHLPSLDYHKHFTAENLTRPRPQPKKADHVHVHVHEDADVNVNVVLDVVVGVVVIGFSHNYDLTATKIFAARKEFNG